MSECKNCHSKIQLLNAFVFHGPIWIRWECPKCHFQWNTEEIKERK